MVRILLVLLAIGALGCQRDVRNPLPTIVWEYSPTPNEPEPTQTARVAVVTATPEPPHRLCVRAEIAVYLRPSPSASYYPIEPVPNGTQVRDTGVRDGSWAFVQVGDKLGWIHMNYLDRCDG